MRRSQSAQELIREATGLAPSFVQERTEPDGSLVWWVEFESETVTRAVVYQTLLAMGTSRPDAGLRLYFYHADPSGKAGAREFLYVHLLWNRSATATMAAGCEPTSFLAPGGLEIADGTSRSGWNLVYPGGVVTRSGVTTDMIAEAAAGRGDLLGLRGEPTTPTP